MKINNLEIISVKDRLPRSNEKALFGFHLTDTHLDGKIVFFSPIGNKWAKIGDKVIVDGEEAYEFDDITDWVDFWAVIPPDFWIGGEE